MKHKLRKDRKSFSKWAIPNQRIITQTKKVKFRLAFRKEVLRRLTEEHPIGIILP